MSRVVEQQRLGRAVGRHRHEPDGVGQSVGRDRCAVADRQHPAALVAGRIVEDVQLAELNVRQGRLVLQRAGRGVGQRLSLVEERAG